MKNTRFFIYFLAFYFFLWYTFSKQRTIKLIIIILYGKENTVGKQEETLRQTSGRILETIFRHKQTSRTLISKELGLTPATVTHTLNHLVSIQKVVETGDEVRAVKGSGRSRRLITLNKDYKYFIGIEINVKGIFLTTTDTFGNWTTENSQSITKYDLKNINSILIQMIQSTLNQHPDEICGGIGIAIPGHFDSKSGRIISNNAKWQHFQLTEIQNTISVPIFLENNINCMALSEYLFHSERSPEHFLFIHIGPGLFCSFFEKQHILTNKDFYIGEIGHTVVNPNGPACECGKRGCLQTYISDSWLLQSAAFLFENAQNTVIKTLVTSPNELSLDTIYNAYLLGDNFIIDKIESGIQYLATSIANTLIIYDSQKIYINSQLLNYPGFSDKLIEQINEQLQFIPNKHNLNIEVLPVNPYRGARGGAALATYYNFIWEKTSQL